jgi:D-glycero-D-manno-heptose 1,7-bisphosphate phosphatase
LPSPPKNLSELEILPGVAHALENFKNYGFKLIVVTNQPDIARMKVTRNDVALIHKYLSQNLPIDAFYMCEHDDIDACNCRKPKPGLIFEAADKNSIALDFSYMVGDRWRDIHAGQAAGLNCFFIDHQYSEIKPDQPYKRVLSLLEASLIITGETYEGPIK